MLLLESPVNHQCNTHIMTHWRRLAPFHRNCHPSSPNMCRCGKPDVAACTPTDPHIGTDDVDINRDLCGPKALPGSLEPGDELSRMGPTARFRTRRAVLPTVLSATARIASYPRQRGSGELVENVTLLLGRSSHSR
jgi:hypothetical protein